MKVDRAKFLVLTGTIGAATALAMASASGCTVVQKNDAADGSAVTPEPTSTDAGTTTTTTDAGAADASKTESCLGNGSSADAGDAGALDCAGLAANGCDLACQNYGDAFKPEIAKAIAECLLKLPTCEGTDAVRACVEGALAKACDDPTAKTFCSPLATACGKNPGDAGANVTQASCEALAKGLTPAGRDSFTSCVTEGQTDYCTADSSWCIDTLK